MRIIAPYSMGDKAVALLEPHGFRVLTAASDCEVLWVHLGKITAGYLSKLDSLRVVCCPATGLDHIDLDECNRRNIKVLSLRDTDVLPTITATAEHTIGLILALVRKIPAAVESTKRGEWERYRFMGRELHDMFAMVIGNGRVGRQVAERLKPFVAGVWDLDREADILGCLRTLYSTIVTIHVDLNDTTRGMCDAKFFAAMKLDSYFVNTSRGQVVDEAALLDALKSGHLAGAALDVLCGEPDSINPELIAFAREQPERLIITPHVGGACIEALEKAECALARRLVEELANG